MGAWELSLGTPPSSAPEAGRACPAGCHMRIIVVFLFVSGGYGVLLRNERYLGWELGSGFPSIHVAHASSVTLAPGKSSEAPPWASVSLFLKRGVGL